MVSAAVERGQHQENNKNLHSHTTSYSFNHGSQFCTIGMVLEPERDLASIFCGAFDWV